MSNSKTNSELLMLKGFIYSAQSTVHCLQILQTLAMKIAPEDTETQALLASLRDVLNKQMILVEEAGK